jgi:hypothetical protein
MLAEAEAKPCRRQNESACGAPVARFGAWVGPHNGEKEECRPQAGRRARLGVFFVRRQTGYGWWCFRGAAVMVKLKVRTMWPDARPGVRTSVSKLALPDLPSLP